MLLGKLKSKPVLVFTMKEYTRNCSMALGGSEWLMPHPSCLNTGKELLCPLGEPQSCCGCFGDGKKQLLLLNCPAHSAVTIPTTLSGSS